MNGRSIQDIIPPARSKPIRPSVTPPQYTPPQLPPPLQFPKPYDLSSSEEHSMKPFIVIAIGAVIVVAVVIGLMSTVFHTARVTVTLSEWKSDVSGSYLAGGDTPLSYQPVVVRDSSSKSVAATGSTKASDHASGVIVVSNLYSTKPQRLITNTRFRTKDGLVYRVHTPITVPGYTTKNGTKIAGTVMATVYASEAGDKFNLPSATFSLPGLKGSPQFDLITAQAKGPLSGGYVGMRATVEKSIRDQAVADLRASLDKTLRQKVFEQAPAGSVIFPDSISIVYTEKPDQADGSNATLSVEATAVAPAFTADALAREIGARAQIASNAPLTLVNSTELSFATGAGGSIEAGDALSFTLSGNAHLVASFNAQMLAEALAGKTRAETDLVVRTDYSSLIEPITTKVYPFWFTSLPKNPERIKVVVVGALDLK